MTQTLTGGTLHRDRDAIARTGARPYWNPYVVGTCWASCCSRPMRHGPRPRRDRRLRAVVAWLASLLVSPDMSQRIAVHAKYWNDGAPLANWTLFLLIGAFVGALVSGWQGRRLRFAVERGPRVTDGQRLALAFVGGFIAAYGAKIAKGCTSGQALTGGSMLNVGSLVFMLAVFASAYGLAYFVRKEWL